MAPETWGRASSSCSATRRFNEAGATMAPETSGRGAGRMLCPAASMRPGQQWPRKRAIKCESAPSVLAGFNEAGATMAPETVWWLV